MNIAAPAPSDDNLPFESGPAPEVWTTEDDPRHPAHRYDVALEGEPADPTRPYVLADWIREEGRIVGTVAYEHSRTGSPFVSFTTWRRGEDTNWHRLEDVTVPARELLNLGEALASAARIYAIESGQEKPEPGEEVVFPQMVRPEHKNVRKAK